MYLFYDSNMCNTDKLKFEITQTKLLKQELFDVIFFKYSFELEAKSRLVDTVWHILQICGSTS